MGVVLVARRLDRLNELAREIEKLAPLAARIGPKKSELAP